MSDIESLKWSVQNGDIDKLKVSQIAGGINDGNGRSLLHCAADYGQTDVLEYLLNLKIANVNAKDNHGLTPLLCAIFESHTECVRLLLNYGADKSVRAPGGESALEAAELEEIKHLLR